MLGRRRQLDDIQESLHKIEAALVVRDPGTVRSVEAYDGLKKQVAAAMRHRRQHLVQLAQLTEALDEGVSLEGLRALTDDWSRQAGIRRWSVPDPLHFFEVTGGQADSYEVITPAWVDGEGDDAVLVKTGRLRAVTDKPSNKLAPGRGDTGTPSDDRSETEPSSPALIVGDEVAETTDPPADEQTRQVREDSA
jgi:hypothetical protein